MMLINCEVEKSFIRPYTIVDITCKYFIFIFISFFDYFM